MKRRNIWAENALEQQQQQHQFSVLKSQTFMWWSHYRKEKRKSRGKSKSKEGGGGKGGKLSERCSL